MVATQSGVQRRCRAALQQADRIINGNLAEDKRNLMVVLQPVVAESHSTWVAFGTMGAY